MLRGMIDLLERTSATTRDQALRRLSKRIATIEVVPYKSYKFGNAPFNDLASFKIASRLVNEWLKPRAAKGEIDVIVMRGVRRLGFDYDKAPAGFTLYPRKLAQGGTLGPESPGGAVLRQRLGLPM